MSALLNIICVKEAFWYYLDVKAVYSCCVDHSITFYSKGFYFTFLYVMDEFNEKTEFYQKMEKYYFDNPGKKTITLYS